MRGRFLVDVDNDVLCLWAKAKEMIIFRINHFPAPDLLSVLTRCTHRPSTTVKIKLAKKNLSFCSPVTFCHYCFHLFQRHWDARVSRLWIWPAEPLLTPTLGAASLNLPPGIGFSLPEGILESVGCAFDQLNLSWHQPLGLHHRICLLELGSLPLQRVYNITKTNKIQGDVNHPGQVHLGFFFFFFV
jgi:hypothetical protein